MTHWLLQTVQSITLGRGSNCCKERSGFYVFLYGIAFLFLIHLFVYLCLFVCCSISLAVLFHYFSPRKTLTWGLCSTRTPQGMYRPDGRVTSCFWVRLLEGDNCWTLPLNLRKCKSSLFWQGLLAATCTPEPVPGSCADGSGWYFRSRKQWSQQWS